MFDFLFKPKVKTYPIIKPETFTPPDAPISTADAKKLYREVMVAIGYLEKDELSEHAKYLGESMKERELEMMDEFSHEKETLDEEILDCKKYLRDLKADLKSAKTDDERGVIALEIGEVEDQIVKYQTDILAAKSALDKYKADKRAFLVDYVNSEIHGQDWKSKK